MSFVVGQWVECIKTSEFYNVVIGKFYRIRETAKTSCLVEGDVGWKFNDWFQPVTWQVGRTYKTTLEGVTVTVERVTEKHVVGVISDTGNSGIAFDKLTGFHKGNDTKERIGARDLTPYLADPEPSKSEPEPTPVDPASPINPPHYQQHPSGVECITITEGFNFNVGNAIKYLWRAGLKGDALTDLRKAAWYVAREIERVEKSKGGA